MAEKVLTLEQIEHIVFSADCWGEGPWRAKLALDIYLALPDLPEPQKGDAVEGLLIELELSWAYLEGDENFPPGRLHLLKDMVAAARAQRARERAGERVVNVQGTHGCLTWFDDMHDSLGGNLGLPPGRYSVLGPLPDAPKKVRPIMFRYGPARCPLCGHVVGQRHYPDCPHFSRREWGEPVDLPEVSDE